MRYQATVRRFSSRYALLEVEVGHRSDVDAAAKAAAAARDWSNVPEGVEYELLWTHLLTPCEACHDTGFLLVDVDHSGEFRIQRCDTCDRFDSDSAANEAAYQLAMKGLNHA